MFSVNLASHRPLVGGPVHQFGRVSIDFKTRFMRDVRVIRE